MTRQRRYIVSIDGVGEAEFAAPTPGKARYAAWLAARDAGYLRHQSFRDFLGRCYTLHLGLAA